MRHLLTLSGWRRIYVCRPSENYQPGGSERKPQRPYGTSRGSVQDQLKMTVWQTGGISKPRSEIPPTPTHPFNCPWVTKPRAARSEVKNGEPTYTWSWAAP